VVSHAGTVLLAELAGRIGLTALLSEATDGLRERRAGHDPGRVLIDVAVAVADGAVTISDIQALADHEGLHGPAGTVASTPTVWRVLSAIGTDQEAGGGMLTRIRLARAQARDRAWTGRGESTGSELPGSRADGKVIGEVVIDLDATLVTAHSEKEDARGNVKGGVVRHPLGAWLDNTNKALAMLLRPGNAGSNTASDHLSVVEQALSQVPDRWRSKNVLIRADGAGYSHALITALSTQGLGFSVGYPVTEAVRDAIKLLPKWAWTAANNADGGLREHADVVEVARAASPVLLSHWPPLACRWRTPSWRDWLVLHLRDDGGKGGVTRAVRPGRGSARLDLAGPGGAGRGSCTLAPRCPIWSQWRPWSARSVESYFVVSPNP